MGAFTKLGIRTEVFVRTTAVAIAQRELSFFRKNISCPAYRRFRVKVLPIDFVSAEFACKTILKTRLYDFGMRVCAGVSRRATRTILARPTKIQSLEYRLEILR